MHTFTAPLWLWEATESAWHFVTLPPAVSDEIDAMTAGTQRGFGSVRVRVTVEGLTWSTSVFPDKQREAFVLPVKKQVRVHAGVDAGDELTVSLEVLD
jgi:hypothetical protein